MLTRNLCYKHFPPVFDYKITFVNSIHENLNSKGDFVIKNRFKMFFLLISGILKSILVKQFFFF